MASEAAGVNEAYEELYVSPTCFVQTAESRFGPEVLDDLKTFVHSSPHSIYVEALDNGEDDYSEDEEIEEGVGLDGGDVTFETDLNHAQHGFPKIATTRNNLTALSQRYNLYLAAYQDRIYVYQPRRAGPRILPPPSLILHPRRSKLAEKLGAAAMDYRFPHQINHIIVGNLGDSEIVLFCYDDGDVAAYYTHSIVRYIKANSDQAQGSSLSASRHGAHPKLFFHENVLSSAWGLAIHEQSRLVAVSSNLHEVTVFAFALSSADTAIKFPDVDDSPRVECGKTAFELQRHFQSRTRTWRIILPLSPRGDNIPSITFVDDEAGEAEKVAAIDIRDNAWFLDIWRIGTPPIRLPHAYLGDFRSMNDVRGWGVLVLPYRDFKPTKTVSESLGVPGGQVIAVPKAEEAKEAKRVWLDTTCSLYYIKGYPLNPEVIFQENRSRVDYAKIHAEKAECSEDDLSDAWETESDSEDGEGCKDAPSGTVEDELAYPLTAGPGKDLWSTISPYAGTPDPSFDDICDETQLSRCVIPSFGETPQLDSNLAQYVRLGKPCNDRQHKTKDVVFAKADLPAHLINNYCLFRTSQAGVELQPLDRGAPCVECKYLLACDNHGGPHSPWDMHPIYSQRMSMVIQIPELSLVAVGSPTGRVALITLTRTAKRLHQTRMRYGFRVDCVLPRRTEDETMRPGCPLIGIAMSPVPCRPGRRLELHSERQRGTAARGVYRLMMHYKNHTILMYDVAREVDKGELLIF